MNATPERPSPPKFFHGWTIVAVGVLVTFASGPGQSYGFAVFIDSIIADTGTTRAGLATLYALGTGLSAAMVFTVSRLADRYGARTTLIGAATGLGLACLAMSQAREAMLVFLLFATLRALGQGSMTINSTLLVARWFVRRRGRAMAIVALGFPLSVAVLPSVCRLLIETIGWRETYAVLGAMIWLLILPWVIAFVRERPEDLGLHPDGASTPPPHEDTTELDPLKPDTRPLLTSARFWLLATALATPSLVITALVFHQSAIIEARGMGAAVAAGIFVPHALASAASTVLAGLAADRYGPKPIFVTAMVVLMLGMVSALVMDSAVTASLYAALVGAALGISRVVSGITWAHFYGRHRLGRVQGTAMMIEIAASALGPLPLAWAEARSGFGAGIALMAALPALAIMAVAVVRPPETASHLHPVTTTRL